MLRINTLQNVRIHVKMWNGCDFRGLIIASKKLWRDRIILLRWSNVTLFIIRKFWQICFGCAFFGCYERLLMVNNHILPKNSSGEKLLTVLTWTFFGKWSFAYKFCVKIKKINKSYTNINKPNMNNPHRHKSKSISCYNMF